MGKALYRKYRSKKLSEIVGQEHITTTLNNALKNNKISHAYLFTGPRGVGKTSIARILAHEINGLPYDEDATHLDIIEIDAASNRRIDEIRDLRDKIHNAPASAKYKVYIIDEVHMLTKEAFNALLKTLEEPPAHAVFILATTEAHKLPETIVSRTQRFTFRPVSAEAVAQHLRTIATAENLSVDDEALRLIAAYGQGSFRDSISLLDQLRNMDGSIDRDSVMRSVGMAPEELIRSISEAIHSKDAAQLIALLNDVRSGGYNASQFASQLGAFYRNELVAGNASSTGIGLMKALLEIPSSQDPSAMLELVLLEQVVKDAEVTQTTVTSKEPRIPKQKMKSDDLPSPPVDRQPTADGQKQTISDKEDNPAISEPRPEISDTTDDVWHQTLLAIKAKHNTLYGLARMAHAHIDGDTLTLTFSFPFHLKRMNDAKQKEILLKALQDISGREISIECILSEKTKPVLAPAVPKTEEHIAAISNIFGNAEVLES